jgi:hypothetical protein
MERVYYIGLVDLDKIFEDFLFEIKDSSKTLIRPNDI